MLVKEGRSRLRPGLQRAGVFNLIRAEARHPESGGRPGPDIDL
jgi:hypothetical protein